jgi:hypothetical protein
VSKYHAMEELAYTGHGNILRFLTWASSWGEC